MTTSSRSSSMRPRPRPRLRRCPHQRQRPRARGRARGRAPRLRPPPRPPPRPRPLRRLRRLRPPPPRRAHRARDARETRRRVGAGSADRARDAASVLVARTARDLRGHGRKATRSDLRAARCRRECRVGDGRALAPAAGGAYGAAACARSRRVGAVVARRPEPDSARLGRDNGKGQAARDDRGDTDGRASAGGERRGSKGGSAGAGGRQGRARVDEQTRGCVYDIEARRGAKGKAALLLVGGVGHSELHGGCQRARQPRGRGVDAAVRVRGNAGRDSDEKRPCAHSSTVSPQACEC